MIDGLVAILTGFNLVLGFRILLVSRKTLQYAIEVENLRTEARAYNETAKTEYEEFESYVDRWYGNREKWLAENAATITGTPTPGSKVEE